MEVEFSFDLPTDGCLLYSDDQMDKQLQERLQGLSGVCDAQLRQILVVSSETGTTIRKGQVLGALSTAADADETDVQEQIGESVDMEEVRR